MLVYCGPPAVGGGAGAGVVAAGGGGPIHLYQVAGFASKRGIQGDLITQISTVRYISPLI